jgi:serine/threonine protein phosphatase PrpC
MPIEDEWVRESDVLGEDELLVVVSDGVFDVLDDSFDEAEARLNAILDPELSCRQIVDRIVDFAVSHDATDDVTAVAVRRIPGGGVEATSQGAPAPIEE